MEKGSLELGRISQVMTADGDSFLRKCPQKRKTTLLSFSVVTGLFLVLFFFVVISSC